MTATDELRKMLDERGVEWMPSVWSAKDETFYKVGDVGYLATEMSSGRMKVCIEGYPTPEQAIAATLGETPTPPPPTPPKQPPYDELIESLRRDWDIEASWDGLRRFWYVGLTDEGVRKRDEREATLGRGTCHDEGDPGDFCCSECGVRLFMDTSDTYTMIASDGRTIIEHPNYCPNCGRRVEQ